MTPSEKMVWERLRGKALGIKFRRQEGFYFGNYRYVADFCCQDAKLIIEIDGPCHNHADIKECDEFREDIFLGNGYKVIRFTNEEVEHDIKRVVEMIRKNII